MSKLHSKTIDSRDSDTVREHTGTSVVVRVQVQERAYKRASVCALDYILDPSLSLHHSPDISHSPSHDTAEFSISTP